MTSPFSSQDLLEELEQIPQDQQMAFLKERLQRIEDKEERNLIQTGVLIGLRLGTPPPKLNVVVLVHGIRTHATWQDLVAHELRQHPNVKVYIVGFEYYPLHHFWFPLLTRAAPIDKVLSELRNISADHRDANISVLAHSFGTYIVTNILQTHPDIQLQRLLLCGAVVPAKFKWAHLPRFPTAGVLNDVGTRDYLPALAKMTSWGYGSSGTFGFKTHKVIDRFHDLGHSDFFQEAYIKSYWVPYFTKGTIVDSEWSRKRPTPPWHVSLLNFFPFKSLLGIAIVAAVYWYWL